MTKHKAYKFRIYPTEKQQELIHKTIGCCRFVYNYNLKQKIDWWEANKEKDKDDRSDPPKLIGAKQLKEDGYEWLSEVDSYALSTSTQQLRQSFQNFFSSVKGQRKGRPVGYPRFRSKHKHRTYTTGQIKRQHGRVLSTVQFKNISGNNHRIKLPKLGWIKARDHRIIPDDELIKSATVRFSPSGKYFVSLMVEYEGKEEKYDMNKAIAVHYKMDGNFLTSEGNIIKYPKYYKELHEKLAREQKKLSRKQGSRKGQEKSNRWKQQNEKVNKIYEKIVNKRMHFYDNIVKNLVDNYDVIITDGFDLQEISKKDLKIEGTNYNRKYGKAVHDNAFGMFRDKLARKCEMEGKLYLKAYKDEPVTQRCSACGHINEFVELKHKTFTCEDCDQTHDREENAVNNLFMIYGNNSK